MPTRPLAEVIQHLGRATPRGGPDLTDDDLLQRFLTRRDTAALEVLVRRHAPMVWGVCRRILQNEADAEDAFQAVFLVLVRRAQSIRTTVGNWLYGVARQTALKARATRAKRQTRERPVTEMPEPAATEPDIWGDLRPLLDHEISLLPEKYRAVLVLCDLEDRSGREAARELGGPEGTVSSRLARARAMLAARLRRHGVAISAGPLAALLSQDAASGCVPAAVVSATIRAVTQVAANPVTAAAVSRPVAALTEGVMRSMSLTKLKTVSAALLVGVLCFGALGRTEPPAAPAPVAAPKSEPVAAATPAKPAAVAAAPIPPALRPAKEPADQMLESAIQNPQHFMFGEQVTSRINLNAPNSFELVITSARGVDGRPEKVYIRSGTMRVFRADARVDEVTKKGGVYWKCGKEEGTVAWRAGE